MRDGDGASNRESEATRLTRGKPVNLTATCYALDSAMLAR
jgi:hypothetical protein